MQLESVYQSTTGQRTHTHSGECESCAGVRRLTIVHLVGGSSELSSRKKRRKKVAG